MNSDLNEQGQTLTEFIELYDVNKYDRPAIAADVVFFVDEDKILLIKRKNHPNINSWAVPGGFIEMDETFEESAARELYEESGVNVAKLHSLGMYGEPTRDPRTRIVSVAFYAEAVSSEVEIAAGDDAADAKLFCYEVAPLGLINVSERQERGMMIALPCSACGSVPEARAEGYELRMENSEVLLSATLAMIDGVSVLISSPAIGTANSQSLAGDHALIIFDAIRARNKI